jgi:glycosyltransferase involved in cell wall biosynthesis
MPIAWILYGSLEQRTGGTIYDAQIVDGLRRAAACVEVLSIDRGADPAALVRRLRRLGPDVIVADELCFRELAFVFPRATFARRVLLIHHLTCWEEELKPRMRWRARHAEAIALRHADHVIATSESTRRRLVAEGHRRPIDVVLSGADRLPLQQRARHAPDPPALRFLFVGAVIPRKRVRELVRAFAQVPPPATLRLVGPHDVDALYTRQVDRAIHQLAGTDRVTFVGEVDDATLSRELAAATVLVLPSSLEGYGIAATEAVRAGVPVIAARTKGLEEALGPCAAAARFVDQGGLAPALVDFATRDAERAAMREAATRASLPTWARAVDEFAALLRAQGASMPRCRSVASGLPIRPPP